MASKELEKRGIHARVVDMHTIKPFDAEMVIKCAKETGAIVTVEDHSINGGLGGAVAEVLAEANLPCKFKRAGLPDRFAVLGSPEEVYKYYHLDAPGIADTAQALLGK